MASWTWRNKSMKPINGFVIVIDIGSPTSNLVAHNVSLAEKSKECLIFLIEQKIYQDSKDEIAIVLLGSEETQNDLFKQGKSNFKNIKVLSGMKRANWDTAKTVQQEVKTTTCHGDWLDGLGVALDLIEERIQQGTVFDKTQILFLTAFDSPFGHCSKTAEDHFISALKDKETQLFFVGSRVTDQSFKKEESNLNDGVLFAQKLLQQVDGSFNSFSDFFSSVVIFSDRPKIGTAWNATLEIGSGIQIPVSGYIKTTKGKNLVWKEETNDASLVDKERTYQKETSESTVDKEDLITAYKYGPENIPFPTSVEEKFTYKSGRKSLSILAFVDTIPPNYILGSNTMYFFAQKEKSRSIDHSAQIALSSLVRAMEEMGKVALVRKVYNDNTQVQIGVLTPRIKFGYECLVFNQLPYADDWRRYKFPPIITLKNQPSNEQLNAVDKLIDQFDLMSPGKLEDAAIESIFDPQEEYTKHILAYKVLHADEPIPEIPAHIKMNITPVPSMLIGAKDVLGNVKELFPLEVVDRLRVNGSETAKRGAIPAAAKELEDNNSAKKPRLNENGVIDLKTILGNEVAKIGTANPIQNFFELLGKKPADEVCQEMEKTIMNLLGDSGGTNSVLLKKSSECLATYRQYCLDEGLSLNFNRWMEQFKLNVIEYFFHDFWQSYVVEQQLGLITREESTASNVEQQEAQTFLQFSRPMELEKEMENDEDLLDLI